MSSLSVLASNRAQVSIQRIANLLFKAELSNDEIRALPAQTLYLAVKHLGVGSCADILQAATIEQCRLMLDFDCWDGDQFSEDSFWEWLAVADEDHGLEILQKLVRCFDLKLVALLLSRHVQTKVFEEKTDNPPEPGFYTPDGGFTWVYVTIQEGTRHFLLTRLLALIFETNAELFYQLLSIPTVATPSMLEEDSFIERVKRLGAEGVPELDAAHQLHAPISAQECLNEIREHRRRTVVQDISIVSPLLYNSTLPPRLDELFLNIKSRDEFESEFTFIMNAALIRWRVPFFDQEGVETLVAKVKGAVSIGLDVLADLHGITVQESYEAIGIQKLYRLGLSFLQQLRSFALKIPLENAEKLGPNSPAFLFLAGARELFPEAPAFLGGSGEIIYQDGKLESGTRAFERLIEVQQSRKQLEQLLSDSKLS
jgi:hypothetical protein